MNFPLPNQVLWLLDVFANHHKELFLVGGCIRNALLTLPIHDYDFTTDATPEEMITILKNEACSCITTGLKHGTLTILKDDLMMEVTTYRFDGDYENHRKPKQVSFSNSLHHDLARRDFTMNAIAWHPQVGIIDPYEGIRDIQNRMIRCVGDPQKRFHEDALRILRAIRFSCSLNFTIDETCLHAIHTHAHLLSFIAKERIREELNKMLINDPPYLLTTLRKLQVLPYMLEGYEKIYAVSQETKWHCFDVFTHTDTALNYTQGYSLPEKLAIIFHDVGKATTKSFDQQGIAHFYKHPIESAIYAENTLRKLAYPKKMIHLICTYIRYHDYRLTPQKQVLRKFLSHLHMDYQMAYAILRIQYADDCAKHPLIIYEQLANHKACMQVLQEMEHQEGSLQLKDLHVNGNDMLALHFHGKQIGEVLQYLYQLVLDDPSLNTKEKLIIHAEAYRDCNEFT